MLISQDSWLWPEQALELPVTHSAYYAEAAGSAMGLLHTAQEVHKAREGLESCPVQGGCGCGCVWVKEPVAIKTKSQ